MDQNSSKKRNKQTNNKKVVNKKKKNNYKRNNLKTSCKYPQDVKDMSINWKRLENTLNQNKSHKSNDNKMNKKKKYLNKNNSNESDKSDNKRTNNKNIWFDGVDKCLIKSSMSETNPSNSDSNARLVKEKSFNGLTKIVAIDCEMVGTGTDGTYSMLARVSIVNLFGHCIYDKYVKPVEEITDYRTAFSGIRPSDLVNAEDFKTVQKQVFDILNNRIVVGHAIHNDFKALLLSHPKSKIRDTSRYFKKLLGGRNPALKRLSDSVLGVKVQTGEHNSIEDARVAMRLYTMFRNKWESDIKKKDIKRSKTSKK
ncbi:RNA exonuclease 4-like [Oppia nitens]|uniref:RNA exonuclease 4-like n=1 Tax=Oppia nitens TaxID=1686743 RepID=UPI0023DB3CE3|nr:RNA exonuclease 4-like [Oppia nitens]